MSNWVRKIFFVQFGQRPARDWTSEIQWVWKFLKCEQTGRKSVAENTKRRFSVSSYFCNYVYTVDTVKGIKKSESHKHTHNQFLNKIFQPSPNFFSFCFSHSRDLTFPASASRARTHNPTQWDIRVMMMMLLLFALELRSREILS